MKLYLYRLSLTEREQLDLLTAPATREEFLRKYFTRSFSFVGWGGVTLRYEFIQEDDQVIAGAICRWVSETAQADPSNPFVEVEGGRWLRSAFFFNMEDHQQVFAIESASAVGAPQAVLASLVKHINLESGGIPYNIEVAEINVKGSFSDAVRSYPGPITTLTFRFVVPNPTDVEKETREALKKLGRRTGAEEVIEKLKSSGGIKN